jgi:cation diffusion facilitator CzcD-associated flavoprotein CzcO
MERQTDSLVIGAGPAGLAAAACLRQCGVPFAVVEQGAALGASWRRHYDRLHLHTDKGHSALPYLDFPKGTPRYPSRDQVVDYLERYALHFGIAPDFAQRVDSVRYRNGEWITTTSGGVYRSKRVVVATGCNAVPHVPQWPGQEHFRGRILHSSEYRNAAAFRDQDVLVVGLGNSGGEIAVDLCEQGARAALAVRGALNVIPREILGVPVLSISIALGRLPARVADMLAAPLIRLTVGDIAKLGLRKLPVGPITQIETTSKVPLIDIGTLELVRAGRIALCGDVRSVGAEGHVCFCDGRSLRFDAIVLATGFRAGLERFLELETGLAQPPRIKAAGVNGLYFCGFRISATGMLRDIGIEARWIAKDIAASRGHWSDGGGTKPPRACSASCAKRSVVRSSR